MDEFAHMDSLGLAWIGMMAKDDRPFILQKAGGHQGTFTYIAFAPARNAAVVIDKFDFGAAFAMGQFANELLEQSRRARRRGRTRSLPQSTRRRARLHRARL